MTPSGAGPSIRGIYCDSMGSRNSRCLSGDCEIHHNQFVPDRHIGVPKGLTNQQPTPILSGTGNQHGKVKGPQLAERRDTK